MHAYVWNVTYFSINKPLVVWLWCDNGAYNVLGEGQTGHGWLKTSALTVFHVSLGFLRQGIWATGEKIKQKKNIITGPNSCLI